MGFTDRVVAIRGDRGCRTGGGCGLCGRGLQGRPDRDRCGQAPHPGRRPGAGRWPLAGRGRGCHQADDVRRVVDEIAEALAPVDVLVHVVGGWLGGTPAVELDPADVATSFDQHVFSTLHMVQAVVPGMQERGWGRILAISQPLATEPGPRGGGYLMAKAAQEVLLRSLARDLAGSGVTANLLIVKTIDPRTTSATPSRPPRTPSGRRRRRSPRRWSCCVAMRRRLSTGREFRSLAADRAAKV